MLQSVTVRWLLCIFVGVCPTETTARIWDLFLRDGRDTLFVLSYGLLKSMSGELMAIDDFEGLFNILKAAMGGSVGVLEHPAGSTGHPKPLH